MEEKEIKDIKQAVEFIRISDDMVKLFEEFEQKAHELILQSHERLKDKGIDNYDLLEQYKMDIFYFLSEGNSTIAYYKKMRELSENEINKRLEEDK